MGGPAGTPESAQGSGRPHLQVAVKPVRVPVGRFLQIVVSLRRRGTIAPIEAVLIHEDFGVHFLFLQPHDPPPGQPGQPGSGGAIPGLWPGTPSPPPPVGGPLLCPGLCTTMLLGRGGQAQTTPQRTPHERRPPRVRSAATAAAAAAAASSQLSGPGAAELNRSGRLTHLAAAHAHKGSV